VRAPKRVIVLAACFSLLGWGLDAALHSFASESHGGRFWNELLGTAPAVALYKLVGWVVLFAGFGLLLTWLERRGNGRPGASRRTDEGAEVLRGSAANARKAGTAADQLAPIIRDSLAVAFLWRHADGWPVEFVTDNVRRFGYEPEDFYSQRVRFLDLIHPDDRWRLMEEQTRAGQEGRVETADVCRLLTRSGEVRWVDGRTRFRRDGAGRITHCHGIMLDITERRKLELRRLQSQKLEAVGTLVNGIAHDFNNLLTAICGYTELARTTLPEDHPAVEPLRMVEQAAGQASGVTRSLLTFSRRHGSLKQPVNLVQMLGEAMRLLRYVLPESVEIVEDYRSEGDIWVRGDRMQLQQVLMNLALNARDAMPEGGRLRIAVRRASGGSGSGYSSSQTDEGGTATLIVEDSGTGMSPDTQARAFEPFFTTKPDSQGSGMGLAVVHGVVTDSGGSVELDSAVGRGTLVRIELPCCAPGPDRVRAEERRETVAGRGETLLVIENDDHVRAIVMSSLRSCGYDVLQARDGREAMQRLLERPQSIRLIALDLDMPRMSGEACLRELRDAGVRVPVVVTTGSSEPGVEYPSLENIHVLRKPFQMADLAAMISRVLAESRDQVGERI